MTLKKPLLKVLLVGPRTQLFVTLTAVLCTLTATGLSLAALAQRGARSSASPGFIAELGVFSLLFLALVYGGLIYQVARAGYFWRLIRRQFTNETVTLASARPLTVLIPSYKEELSILRQTVVSAALLDYADRRIAVLLDDPPQGSPEDMAALAAARIEVSRLHEQFAAAAGPLQAELESFLTRRKSRHTRADLEAQRLSRLYEEAACWIEDQAVQWICGNHHAERFLSSRVIQRVAAELRHSRETLVGARLSLVEAQAHYWRLACLFRVSITSFERKRYSNLSHAANKAMNLNAYIGLIGGHYREGRDGPHMALNACSPGEATLSVPPADFLLTLDADSVLTPDYAQKLMAIMQADERIAVAQTPYSAFPGAPGALERIAGATTDLQYIVHQGSCAFSAAYWVGANALLRREALVDIRTFTEERGRQVPVFIQDRTVIEDTGSTIDLIRRGWRLHNHPERLAYSATPPDFGSLAIQRRRWSNGGLIILPDLIRHALRLKNGPSLGEALIRAHYLVSPALANLALVMLLFLPFDPRLSIVWLPLTAAPYFLVYALDLKASGYGWRDLLRVYALNLLLLPVNLAGVFDSLRQLVTGKKSPFARTPKIEGRTVTPRAYVLFQWLAVSLLALSISGDLAQGAYGHAVLLAVNISVFSYGYLCFLGWRDAWRDLAGGGKPDAGPDIAIASRPASSWGTAGAEPAYVSTD